MPESGIFYQSIPIVPEIPEISRVAQETTKTGRKGRKMNPRSLANLKPATCAADANRNPTGINQYTWLNNLGMEVLKERLNQGGTKKQALKIILEKLRYEFLVNGNVAAGKELLDRVFGHARQSMDITTKDMPLNIPAVDLTVLTADKLSQLREMLRDTVRHKF